MSTLIKMLKDQSGASAAEYALILAVIGSALVIGALALGQSIGSAMNRSSNCIRSAGASCS
jgi:pilus assembly protein Flp/PilA